MSKRHNKLKRLRYYRRLRKCQHPGCQYQGLECWLPENFDKADEILCPEHAEEAGYCRYCGWFAAGTEGFDFYHRGLCDNCWFGVEDEEDEEGIPYF